MVSKRTVSSLRREALNFPHPLKSHLPDYRLQLLPDEGVNNYCRTMPGVCVHLRPGAFNAVGAQGGLLFSLLFYRLNSSISRAHSSSFGGALRHMISALFRC
jgi:hypothetical protein